MVATDSYRLAIRNIDGIKGIVDTDDILVPSSALREVLMLVADKSIDSDEVSVVIRDHDAVFSRGSVVIRTRLLDGSYPNYRQIIPVEYPNRITANKTELAAALNRVRLLVRDATTPVKMSMHADGIDLSVNSAEVGDAFESVNAIYDGADMNIAFNPTYMLDGLDAIAGDVVVIKTIDATKPAIVSEVDDDTYTYLLMPVRVS